MGDRSREARGGGVTRKSPHPKFALQIRFRAKIASGDFLTPSNPRKVEVNGSERRRSLVGMKRARGKCRVGGSGGGMGMTVRGAIAGLVVAVAAWVAPAMAQDGGALFNTYCAICHQGTGNASAPGRDAMGRLAPEQILQTMETGSMKAQAAERSRAQRRALAEYISGKPLPPAPPIIPASARCTTSGESRAALNGPVWNGWGGGLANARFQPAEA